MMSSCEFLRFSETQNFSLSHISPKLILRTEVCIVLLYTITNALHISFGLVGLAQILAEKLNFECTFPILRDPKFYIKSYFSEGISPKVVLLSMSIYYLICSI